MGFQVILKNNILLGELLEKACEFADPHGYYIPTTGDASDIAKSLLHQLTGVGRKAALSCQEMTIFLCLKSGVWKPTTRSKLWRGFVQLFSNPVKAVVRLGKKVWRSLKKFFKKRKKRKHAASKTESEPLKG